ncbi:hypothetical protein [Runella sp.]|uniref:hypothetical protein n=1 Tax=Runella sp. TaxID=1960881 RepID=UPI003D0E2F91
MNKILIDTGFKSPGNNLFSFSKKTFCVPALLLPTMIACNHTNEQVNPTPIKVPSKPVRKNTND